MADKKISELDAIVGADTAADDFFIVVDTSGTSTKKISRAELNNAIERDVLSTVNIDGGTIDGTTIGGTTTAAGSFTTLQADTSLNVDGTVTADGLTVAGSGLFTGALTATPSGAGHVVSLSGNESRIRAYGATAGTGYLTIRTGGGGGSGDSEAMRITQSGSVQVGSASSATNKLFVYDSDASDSVIYARQDGAGPIQTWHGSGGTERLRVTSSGQLAIGNSSPTSYNNLEIYDANSAIQTNEVASGGTGVASLRLKHGNNHYGMYVASADALIVYDYGSSTEQMRITSGKVGIGCSPVAKLQVKTQTNGNAAFQNSTSLSGGVKINAFNDAANASVPFEIDGSSLQFNIASSEAMRIDSSARVGIGAVPNTNWRNTLSDKVLMLGTEATFLSDAGVTTELFNNAYVNNSNVFKNISTRGASRYFQYSGEHRWYTAASAAAGSTITSEINTSPKMILKVSGNLGLGTSSASQPLHIARSSGAAYIFQDNGTANTYLGPDGSNTGLFGTSTNHDTRFITNNTERFRITSGGGVYIGDSSSNMGANNFIVAKSTNLGNRHNNTTGGGSLTELSGTSLTPDGTNWYGSYGQLRFHSNSSYTSNARRFLITNGLATNKFAIIQSTGANTDPDIEANGGHINNGNATFVIHANSHIGIKSNAAGVGYLTGPRDNAVTVADDSTVTLHSGTVGAWLVHIYNTNAGDGAVYFVTYAGAPVLVASRTTGIPWATTDTDGSYCLTKTSNSHTCTFKNRSGSSKNFVILVTGSQTW